MTDTTASNAPSGEPTLIERAHLMLAQAGHWGHLTDDEQLMVMASGRSTGKQQAMALQYAGVLALVSIAESLATLVDVAWTAGLMNTPEPEDIYTGPLPGETVRAESDPVDKWPGSDDEGNDE